MSICSKCHQLHDIELARGAAQRLCPRCLAVAELLEASAALHRRVRDDLARSNRQLRVIVLNRSGLAPILDRTEKAIAQARAL